MTARTGQLGKGNLYRTATTGQSGQDIWARIIGIGEPRQIGQEKSAWQVTLDRSERTDSRDRTAVLGQDSRGRAVKEDLYKTTRTGKRRQKCKNMTAKKGQQGQGHLDGQDNLGRMKWQGGRYSTYGTGQGGLESRDRSVGTTRPDRTART
jgi:hypothetical protein